MRAAILFSATILAACSGTAPKVSDGSSGRASAGAVANNTGTADASPIAKPDPAAACTTQDGRQIPANKLRALGTEPFWSAEIDGRCVTYFTPQNQSGTRVWAKFDASQGGSWSGSLDGKPFKLSIKKRQDCSDGMSDRSFPFEATLQVNGEERRGCAEPR